MMLIVPTNSKNSKKKITKPKEKNIYKKKKSKVKQHISIIYFNEDHPNNIRCADSARAFYRLPLFNFPLNSGIDLTLLNKSGTRVYIFGPMKLGVSLPHDTVLTFLVLK